MAFPRSTAASVQWWAALLLVAVDLHLIGQYAVLYYLRDLGQLAIIPRRLDLGHDSSVSELLNAGKWAGIALLLLAVWWRLRVPTAMGFAVVFAIIMLDDALMLHENGGAALVLWLGLEGVAGLRGQDVGELVVWASLGCGVGLSVLLGFWRADEAGRRVGRRLLVYLGALLFFAVALDMVHILVMKVTIADFVLGLLEDGGEMITGSLCLAYSLALAVGDKRPVSQPIPATVFLR